MRFYHGHSQLLLLLISILSCISLTVAAKPTSFCKCTCFSNSTIIPLNPGPTDSAGSLAGIPTTDDNGNDNKNGGLLLRFFDRSSSGSSSFDDSDDYDSDAAAQSPRQSQRRDQKYHELNCNDCNRKFCLDYQLPTCKGAKEEDVFTTCFQRDSRKDEAVVMIFIFATSGLLAWAACKPWVEKYMEAARERRTYIPVSEGNDR